MVDVAGGDRDCEVDGCKPVVKSSADADVEDVLGRFSSSVSGESSKVIESSVVVSCALERADCVSPLDEAVEEEDADVSELE